MKKKLAVSAIVLSLVAIAFAQTLRPVPSISMKAGSGSQVLKIRSAGEEVAQLRLMKPTQVDFDGGRPFAHNGGGPTLIRQATNIYLTVEGQTPWRISGADLEVEVIDEKKSQ